MEFVYVVVGAIVGGVVGAAATWYFTRLTNKGADDKASSEQVIAARHKALEAGQAVQVALLTRSTAIHDALLESTQAVNRLMALGDVTGATRAMQWLIILALPTFDEEDVNEALTDFILHINDPVREPEPPWV